MELISMMSAQHTGGGIPKHPNKIRLVLHKTEKSQHGFTASVSIGRGVAHRLALRYGQRVSVAFDPDTKRMVFIPAQDGTPSVMYCKSGMATSRWAGKIGGGYFKFTPNGHALALLQSILGDTNSRTWDGKAMFAVGDEIALDME